MEENIMTVKGPIESSLLGYCQSHEHLFIADGKSAEINPSLRIDDYDKTLSEVNTYREYGGRSIVDAQPVGCGRMADKLLKTSVETDINIIASTGFHKLMFYPDNHWIKKKNTHWLSQLFIDEFKNGMYIDADNSLPSKQISAKPGIIKIASEGELSCRYHELFLAAAEASVETGMPLLVHLEMGKGALEQIQLLTENGVPVEFIILCHLDRDLQDLKYHKEVAETGVYMEYDTIGRYRYHSDQDEAKFIANMVQAGFQDRILLGLDTTKERLKSYGGKIGLDYIINTFVPILKKYGNDDDIIKGFMVDNPKRAFANYK